MQIALDRFERLEGQNKCPVATYQHEKSWNSSRVFTPQKHDDWLACIQFYFYLAHAL